MNTIQQASHAQFVVSKWNVRKTGGENVDELAALILSAGRVLQNVIAFRQKKKGVETGKLEIVAGGRRWRAVNQLISNGQLPTDFELDWLEISEEQAIELSLAENTGREAMHPADEFEAMQVLIKKGKAIEDVAAAFGIEPLVVKRRLKLANVSPILVQLYREDKATLAQLEALAITDDHTRQEQVWQSLPEWNRSASKMRQMLTNEQMSVRDKVAQYVGVSAYVKAGGTVRTDLFSKNGEDGFIEDVALVESLALAKLAKNERNLLKEGFAWVDVSVRSDYEEIRSYGRPRSTRRDPNEIEQATLAQLQQEQDQLDRDIEADQDNDDYNEALSVREDELAERWDAYSDALMVVHPDDVACVGALVTINNQGQCEIIKNLLRPEDVKRIKKEEKATPTSDGADTAEKPRHSERLTRELTAQRTIALQAEMMNRPNVALVTLAAHLAKAAVYDDYHRNSIVKISVERESFHAAAPTIEECKAWQAVEAKRAQLKQALPEGVLWKNPQKC